MWLERQEHVVLFSQISPIYNHMFSFTFLFAPYMSKRFKNDSSTMSLFDDLDKMR